MNILFIDNIDISLNDNINKVDRLLFNYFGIKLKKMKNAKIYYININTNKLYSKLFMRSLKNILRLKFKNKKVYIVLSKTIEEDNKIKEILSSNIKNLVFVSNQNNLYDNDKIYIKDYILKKKLDKNNIKILVVIDKLENAQKRKIQELLEEYKIVDIYSTEKERNLKEYVEKINNNLGTVVEIIDKIPKEYYNILLVFSKKYENNQTKSSFFLDYNNSDLDIKSNTYLIFKNNKKYFNIIFNDLGMCMSRFEKTKLGKLYIHASRIILDI